MSKHYMIQEKTAAIMNNSSLSVEQKYKALETLMSRYVGSNKQSKGDYRHFPVLSLAYIAIQQGEHEECLYELHKCIRCYSPSCSNILHHVLYFLQHRNEVRDIHCDQKSQ